MGRSPASRNDLDHQRREESRGSGGEGRKEAPQNRNCPTVQGSGRKEMTGIGKVIIAGVISLLVIGAILFTAYGRVNGPEQPIKFSHKIHAGDFKIACEYCHSYARRSTVAGVPSVARCMGCHKVTALDKPEVKKLADYWNRKEAIPWVKIFDQPDFVYFSHEPHVLKGIACQICHGPVERMEQVREAVVLNMERCVTCHM